MRIKRIFIVNLVFIFLFLLSCSELNENYPQAAKERCEACHLLPPIDNMHTDTVNHPFVKELSECKKCHTAYIHLTDFKVEDNLHNNGKIDFDSTRCLMCHKYNDCNSCHRSPPLESWNSRVVRMHDVHYRKDDSLLCNVCHKGYDVFQKKIDEKIHDNGNIDIIFDVIKKDPEDPEPYYKDGVCYNLYCHGASTIGGKKSVSVEENMGSGVEKCNFCHNIDSLLIYGPTHSIEGHKDLYPQCLNCHPGFSCSPQLVITDEKKHRNGKLDTIPGEKCFECHMTITH